MSDPFLGQISSFGFNFPPFGWMACQGQTLPISQFSALFSLLGTQFGGNGTSNFQLPNLQGNVPLGQGQGPGLSSYAMGETGGSQNVSVIVSESPSHNHSFMVQNSPANQGAPSNGSALAQARNSTNQPFQAYAPATLGTATTLAPTSISPAGGSQPHNNMQPTLAINWCIATQGVFPSRS